ncbi:MAG: peptidase glycoprotease [Solirubrobacterales bacterium]|nr:peptidase glycoprotease [Solirubrobacterales bacterium]
MIILGFDTATPATAVALLDGDEVVERRHDPEPGERPGHATRLLALLAEVMAEGGVGWERVDRIAAGIGPGSFTGLRIGLATARSLAQSRALPLVGVSSLAALAEPARAQADRVVAVLDARRGEVFAAAWEGRDQVLAPVALAPEALAERLRDVGSPSLAAGDGAVRFREQLEPAGVVIPADGSPLHRLSAAWICRLGARAEAAGPGTVLPSYLREPDAHPRQRP